MRVASMREVGHMFQEKRTPLWSSTSLNTSIAEAAIVPAPRQVDSLTNDLE